MMDITNKTTQTCNKILITAIDSIFFRSAYLELRLGKLLTPESRHAMVFSLAALTYLGCQPRHVEYQRSISQRLTASHNISQHPIIVHVPSMIPVIIVISRAMQCADYPSVWIVWMIPYISFMLRLVQYKYWGSPEWKVFLLAAPTTSRH